MAEMDYLPGGIRERMEDLRNRRKLTLKEVSEKTGIDYSTLSRIENGNVKKVGDDVLLKLARFFGVSTDFLLGITDVPDKKKLHDRRSRPDAGNCAESLHRSHRKPRDQSAAGTPGLCNADQSHR